MQSSSRAALNTERTGAKYSDAEWITRIRGGDLSAFEALVNHYSDPLCAWVYSHIHDAEITRELTQDLFLWIWGNRRDWDVHSGLTSYLYRAVHNRVVSYQRHARLERRWREEMDRRGANEFDQLPPVAADAEADANDLAASIERSIAALPERCRQVFVLNRKHHLTYGQIAETLGISIKTVESHMARALVALRRDLADWLS